MDQGCQILILLGPKCYALHFKAFIKVFDISESSVNVGDEEA